MLLHTTSETGQPAVYINGGSIAARSIYSAQIQANAIVADHIDSEQITSDHISTAGITADNIKGKTLSSSVPLASGGSFINLDTGDINFAGGNLTWNNTTKTFYINANTLQIGGKNVLNTDTDLAKQINNKSTTRIQGNKLHFTNQVLMDDAFIELLTANNIFAQKIDAREIDANRITSGTLEADYIQGGTFDGQSMIVKNITADAIKGGTFDGQSMTIKNLTADAIVAGTLDMSKFTVSNLSADDIKTGTLDISGGLRVTSGRHQIMSIDPETLDLEFNVNKMTIGGVKLISEEDQPQMEENIANELEGKLKQHLHIAYADDASGNGFSFSPLNKSYLGMYSDYNKEPLKAKEKYQWIKIEGNTGKSSKTHIAYANRKNGLLVDFSLTDSDREYLGIYSNFSEEPPSPEVYKWTKIKGEVGNPGQDAITIVLSNEAHTFVAGVTNAEAASDIIKVDAYKGTTKTSVKIGTITGTIADKITATIANNNTTNAQITINVTTALTTSSGNITIPITVDGKSFSKVYSWALSFKGNTGSAGGKGKTGAPGANAKLVTLTATGQIFTKPKVGSITPSKITVTASGQNTTISTSHWQYSINGGAFTTTKPAYVTVINSTTVDVANTMSNKTLAIKVRTADAVEDTLTIARIEDGLDGSDGTDATIAFLSNESHTFAGDINNAIAATDSIEVTAYKGSTKQNVSIGTITGQVTGLTAAIASNTNNTTAPKITITVTTALKEISGTLTIPLTVNGTIYTRYYSWSVARKGATGGPGSQGSPGSDAQILTLTPNNQVFKVPKTGAITPATITITATGQNISVPTANANWQYSVNGGNLTTTLPTGVTRSGAVVTVNGTTFTGNTLTTKVSSGTIQDTVTIYKAIDGVDGSKGDKGAKGDTGPQGPRGATGSQGPRGNTGTSVESVTEYYLATSVSSGIKSSNTGFKTTIQPLTATNKYLWNYEKINFSDGTDQPTIPVIIGVYGDKGQTGSTGATGRSIVSITEHYLATSASSGVTRSTSGWDTKMQPTTETNKYLWNYETINWSSGTTTTYVEPIIIGVHGAKGPQGPQGPQGIKGANGSNGQSQWVHIRYSANSNGSGMDTKPSSTTKYVGIAVTNSATAPVYTGFTWSKYVGENGTNGSNGAKGPQGVPGKNGANGKTTYTWVRYADTPTSGMNQYPANKKYIGLAFNKTDQNETNNYNDYQWSLMPQNIDIGVQNLILGSGTPVESSAYLVKEYFISEDFVEGQEYTVTIKGTKNSAVNFGLWQNVGSSERGSFKHVKDDLYQLTFTSVATTAGNARRIRIYQPPSGSGGKATIEWIKMVKGDYSSLDWSPAPEDVTASIKAAQDKANAASNSASTANSLLADIASDSVLTPGEKKNIKKEWDVIVGEKPKIDASANTYGITTQKTAYNNAYNALNTYLTGSSGLLVNLNIKSAIVGTTFRNNFKNYYNARQDLLNAISNGAKSLVDNIEIGGENLFAITNTVDGYESKGNIAISTAVHRTMSNLVSIGDTKSLIYQIWNPNKRINTSNGNRVAFFTEANVYISSVAMPQLNGSTYQMFKIDVPTNARKARLGAIMGIGTIDPLIKIKFEKGNKATDWSPSPEDIEADYTAVAQAKADAERIKAQSYADGKLSAEEKKRIADAENKYKKALILSRASSGKLMNSDPNFSKNLNEFTVYNNASNGNVSIQYENASSSSSPSGVTRRLRVTTIGTASPHWGGIVPSKIFMSRANAEYVIRFTALLPKGRSFNYAQNAMGTGYTGEWLTSTAGTGSWEEYIYYYKCGSTGSFSSFGHLYALGGTTPTTASPLVWYLDKYEGLDVSNVTGNPSQEDVDKKASAEDLINAENGLSTSIGDLSNIVDGKVDKSIYEEFLEHNADIQQQLSDSTVSAQENIDKALARTSIVEQKLGEGAADWIFTHTKIRMSDEGITLGEEGSGSYLQISNEQISFFNGSKEPVAFINGGMLHINHAIFVESIQISEFMFSSEISGHLTLRYVGN